LHMTNNDPLKQQPIDLTSLPVQELVIIIQTQAQQIQAQARQIQSLTQQLQTQAQQIQAQAQQIQTQAEIMVVMKKTIEELKDEIDRLNKKPKRPKFRKGGMEPRDRRSKKSPDDSDDLCGAERTQHNPEKQREEKCIPPAVIPEGSRFKGYKEFLVQEVKLIAVETLYKLEVWVAPDGSIHKGELPSEIGGQHFGPKLRALIINLYAQGMTQPSILEFLHGIGIEISSGQVHNILMNESVAFSSISEKILSVGLRESDYIETDDTGAKHQHKNGYCTYLGNKCFSYYKSSPRKSRGNFLSILLQGKEGYYVNESMIWHLAQGGVEDHILHLFEECKGKKYKSKKGLRRLLSSLGITGKKLTEQSFEAATVGYIAETILKKDQVLLSDRAGQFAILNHAACWVHMERPLRKILATNEAIEKELEEVRAVIWKAYHKFKEFVLTGKSREEVESAYDEITSMTSVSPGITEVIMSFREYREEMLKALDYPSVPLHNNGSEQSIREMVKRRDISGSTKSEEGQKFRDGLATVKQTCRKLGVSLYHFVVEHFHGKPLDLPNLVSQACRGSI